MQNPSVLGLEPFFSTLYEGFRALQLTSSSKTRAIEELLASHNVSYRTKIVRSRVHGTLFLVLLAG